MFNLNKLVVIPVNYAEGADYKDLGSRQQRHRLQQIRGQKIIGGPKAYKVSEISVKKISLFIHTYIGGEVQKGN